MTPREIEEYRALSQTTQARGTARIWVFVAGLVAWAGLVIATAALAALPVATLLPLLVLAGVFEAVLTLHLGVERIGRYIQVFYEDDEGDPPDRVRPGWERTEMAYGAMFPGAGGDPLFAPIFITATVLNFVPVLIAEPVAIEISAIGTAHVLFLARIVSARRRAVQQSTIDLQRFRQLKRTPPTSAPAQ